MDEENKELEQESEENSTAQKDDAQSTISADLIRGHINTIILRTLYERDKYGYEIIEEIEAKSHGQYTLKQPTLYSALKRLESQGYITAYWKTDEVSQGGRRKYYTLTDSGREVTEKNQAEWEYSRTVIDNLISDRSYDFSQPAPTPVDFKILKNSTSRVPIVKDVDEEKESLREVKYDEQVSVHAVEQPASVSQQTSTAEQTVAEQPASVSVAKPAVKQTAQTVEQPAETYTERTVTDMTEEQRRIVHENYLKLISEPVEQVHEETPTVPYSENIDTEKLIYNNKPEPERDYRNLINNLYSQAVNRQQPPTPAYDVRQTTVINSNYEDANVKADKDGLTVNTSEYSASGTRRQRYNRGSTLFKCSLIISVIMLLEFALCLIFKKELGVGYAYPFVIFILACAQTLIFGVLMTTGVGKNSRKPTNLTYLSACVIIAVILILIITVTSLLLRVNFSSGGDIMAKIVIPCIVTLNIPLFAVFFYVFSK